MYTCFWWLTSNFWSKLTEVRSQSQHDGGERDLNGRGRKIRFCYLKISVLKFLQMSIFGSKFQNFRLNLNKSILNAKTKGGGGLNMNISWKKLKSGKKGKRQIDNQKRVSKYNLSQNEWTGNYFDNLVYFVTLPLTELLRNDLRKIAPKIWNLPPKIFVCKYIIIHYSALLKHGNVQARLLQLWLWEVFCENLDDKFKISTQKYMWTKSKYFHFILNIVEFSNYCKFSRPYVSCHALKKKWILPSVLDASRKSSEVIHNAPSIKWMWLVEFLNNSQFEVFLSNWEVVFFLIFSMEFIVCMYLKVCVWLDTQKTPLTEGKAGYFIHNDGYMIPRNDVLVLSLPPN